MQSLPEKLSCFSDQPIKSLHDDHLKNNQYALGLLNFIKIADAPITIGIQGGWGSGKTSLINLLQNEMEASDDTLCINVNAWQQSLFASSGKSGEIALALLESAYGELIEQIQGKAKRGKIKINDEQKQNILRLGKTVVRLTAAFAGIPLAIGDDSPERTQQRPSQAFKKLRTDLNEAIHSLIADSTNNLKRVVIFVDDLDRIQPETAVEVLDVLKNVFDIQHCISVLAIDYDVVIKGLRRKFGDQERNQREFRQYFDKIIQIPFSMPTSAYRNSVPAMLERLLETILPETADAHSHANVIEDISDVALMATDGIPRSIKRIVNTVSLLSIIDAATPSESDKAMQTQDVAMDLQFKILFTVVCLQVSFPEIHKALCQLPDLKRWDEEKSSTVWHLSELDEGMLGSLSLNFDKYWEPTLLKLVVRHELISKAMDIRDIVRELDAFTSQPGGLQALKRTLRSTSITDTDTENGLKIDADLSKDDATDWCREVLEQVLGACEQNNYFIGNLDRRKKAKDGQGEWTLTHDATSWAKRIQRIDIVLSLDAEPWVYSIDFMIPGAKTSRILRDKILASQAFIEVLENQWFRISLPANPSGKHEPNLESFRAETLPDVILLLEMLS